MWCSKRCLLGSSKAQELREKILLGSECGKDCGPRALWLDEISDFCRKHPLIAIQQRLLTATCLLFVKPFILLIQCANNHHWQVSKICICTLELHAHTSKFCLQAAACYSYTCYHLCCIQAYIHAHMSQFCLIKEYMLSSMLTCMLFVSYRQAKPAALCVETVRNSLDLFGIDGVQPDALIQASVALFESGLAPARWVLTI